MIDHDPVNHPKHYASDATCSSCNEPIECIDVVRHLSFNIGNAIKYIWRAGKKEDVVQDLRKAVWYLEDQIAMLEGRKNPNVHALNKPWSNISEAMIREPIADVISTRTDSEGFHVEARMRPCEYEFKDGDYVCFIHQRGTDRHPREGVNRPCRFVSGTEVVTHQEGS